MRQRSTCRAPPPPVVYKHCRRRPKKTRAVRCTCSRDGRETLDETKTRNLEDRPMEDGLLRIGAWLAHLGPRAGRRWQHRHVNSLPRPRSIIKPQDGRHRTEEGGNISAGRSLPSPPPQRSSALNQPVKAFDADLIGLGWCWRQYLVLALIRPSHLLFDPVMDHSPTRPASPTASLSPRQNGKHVWSRLCPCRASAPRPKKHQSRVSQRCG